MQIYEIVWPESQINLFESNNIHIQNLLWPALRNNLIFHNKQSTCSPKILTGSTPIKTQKISQISTARPVSHVWYQKC